MNKVVLMGRLTDKPELKSTPQGTSLTSFSLAVNRRFAKEGQQQADFIRCTAWKNTAEFICKYFDKGNMIAVVGNIQTRSWDSPDGKKLYATDVVVDEAYFTGSKTEGHQVEKKANEEIPSDFDSLEAMGFIADASGDDSPF